MHTVQSLAYEVAAKDAVWPVLPIIMANCETGEIVYVSRYAADIFGYEIEELMHQPVEVIVPDELRVPHSSWRKDANVPKTRLMGVGRQIRGRRKDGSTFPVHIGLTSMQVLDKMIGIAFVIDLTGVVP